MIDYLAKKGYSRTEAMLRMESANQEIDGRPLPPLGEDARPKYQQGFGKPTFFLTDRSTVANNFSRLAEGLGRGESRLVQGQSLALNLPEPLLIIS